MEGKKASEEKMSDEAKVKQMKLDLDTRPRFAGEFLPGQRLEGFLVDEVEAENERLRAKIEELEKK